MLCTLVMPANRGRGGFQSVMTILTGVATFSSYESMMTLYFVRTELGNFCLILKLGVLALHRAVFGMMTVARGY
jgi:hypothetical protein